MENRIGVTLSNAKTIQREKEIYFKKPNLFLKLIDMEDKDTGIQFLYHFKRFKNRVLGEYIYFTAITLNLDIWSPISREGKTDGNCQSMAVHSDSYSRAGRIAVCRSLSFSSDYRLS